MKNALKLFGIIALAAVIGFSMAACDNTDGGGNGTNNGGNETNNGGVVTGVTLNKKSIFLTVGGTETLKATISPSNATIKQ